MNELQAKIVDLLRSNTVDEIIDADLGKVALPWREEENHLGETVYYRRNILGKVVIGPVVHAHRKDRFDEMVVEQGYILVNN